VTPTVAVEKLDILKHGVILVNGKWSLTCHRSLVGHPDGRHFGSLPAVEFFNNHNCQHSMKCA
jgi:hypothetical protein